MASLDEIIGQIQATKKTYEDGQQALINATKGVEEGAQAMEAVGVVDKAEMLEDLKSDLETITTTAASLAEALETAATKAEAIKG